MFALIGQSILFDVSRSLQGRHPISYFQYRALSSFIEAVSLHDGLQVLVGNEKNQSFATEYHWLLETLSKSSDLSVNILPTSNLREIVYDSEKRRFKDICDEIYKYPLGITTADLLDKHQKDRFEEDMAENIEAAFLKDYPDWNPANVAEEIYYLWQRNSNSAEMMYFFRAHLLQAISEVRSYTPFFESQKILASLLQKRLRPSNRIGTLPHTIYNLVNCLFMNASRKYADLETYPSTSLLLHRIVDSVSNRDQIIEAVLILRDQLSPFREYYSELESVLADHNLPLSIRTSKSLELKSSLEKVWIPLSSSFGAGIGSNPIWRSTKSFLEKYGIGDVKLTVAEKSNELEKTGAYSTPSLIGFSTALVRSIYETVKESNLHAPSKPLIDLVLQASTQTGTRAKLEEFLPLKKYNKKINTFIERNLLEVSTEV